jgi:hypothetical protein
MVPRLRRPACGHAERVNRENINAETDSVRLPGARRGERRGYAPNAETWIHVLLTSGECAPASASPLPAAAASDWLSAPITIGDTFEVELPRPAGQRISRPGRSARSAPR